jgi:hypothetical protein
MSGLGLGRFETCLWSGVAIDGADWSLVLDVPETQYARTDDGAHLAYQVIGQGPPELVFLPLGATHDELAWEIPIFARVFWRLASFSRLIRFDMRGSGLSDPFNA